MSYLCIIYHHLFMLTAPSSPACPQASNSPGNACYVHEDCDPTEVCCREGSSTICRDRTCQYNQTQYNVGATYIQDSCTVSVLFCKRRDFVKPYNNKTGMNVIQVNLSVSLYFSRDVLTNTEHVVKFTFHKVVVFPVIYSYLLRMRYEPTLFTS